MLFQNSQVNDVIINCLKKDPNCRPILAEIKSILAGLTMKPAAQISAAETQPFQIKFNQIEDESVEVSQWDTK